MHLMDILQCGVEVHVPFLLQSHYHHGEMTRCHHYQR